MPKSKFLNSILQNKGIKNAAYSIAEPLGLGGTVKRFAKFMTFKNIKKPKMLTEEKKYLIDYYKNDIIKLQELLNKDLSHWLK